MNPDAHALCVSAAPQAAPPSAVRAHPRIVAIGGGTGLPAVLRGLRPRLFPPETLSEPRGARDALTAIVTVTDDGGSSGRLRRELDMLPPGDIRNCLAALAPMQSSFATLLQYRFTRGRGLHGHTVGNLLLAALTEIDGDFLMAVEKMSDLLDLRGRVLPSSLERVALRAEFEGGESAEGESAIVACRRRIKRLGLERHVRPLPESLRALVDADTIVVGPGSLYTSILPNLLVDGVAPTLSGVDAVRIYVANLMTEPGETDDLTLEDHLAVIREHVGFDLFDYVLVNRHAVSTDTMARYAARGSRPVRRTGSGAWVGQARVVRRNLAWHADGGTLRHAPGDLAAAIMELRRLGRPSRPSMPTRRARTTHDSTAACL